ncbi:unnamed protein product [Didymodactylos carnosus]|uniref:Ubiquitin carboxyl-terminal hydrolase n=1 Tax=Didymodactylos carnosus TaxID=1234261 RepID=A0A814IYB2_9BILA|nr:unnamed protein product [Didymodactylos carnosus]CAF1102661.1 unnamed protein product [Didymodactylos carnosus]CAF3801062.1 unnamed protein product [Didymodactylos carnosus]CAF3863908.1 unnamed protein product [Didymodactylos carnosus]
MDVSSSLKLKHLKSKAVEQLHMFVQSTDEVLLCVFNTDENNWIPFDQNVEDYLLNELGIANDSYICIDIQSNITPGVCGLNNTGNTCFMNCAIQCLSNVPQLTDYFLKLKEPVNPLIDAYSQLMKSMWSGHYSLLTPEPFIALVRETFPRFTEWKQHDAQEFMNYLIDMMHTEVPLVKDLFYDRINSTVRCLVCNSVESKTEPISFLPLPLPITEKKSTLRMFEIDYIKLNGDIEYYSVETRENGTILSLIQSLIDHCLNMNLTDIPDTDRIIAAKVSNNRQIRKYFQDEYLSWIIGNQMTLFEVPQMIDPYHQIYTPCLFFDKETSSYFRPPIFLVRVRYNCQGQDLLSQLESIIQHIISVVGETTVEIFWTSDIFSEKRRLQQYLNETIYFIDSVIIDVSNSTARKYIQSKHNSTKNSLSTLIENFLKEDDLDGRYDCSTCKKLTTAKQQTNLCFPLPPIVIIQLKRFIYDAYSNDKIDTLIDYPVNSFSFGQDGILYDLIAVLTHNGSLSSGHYVTYAKNYQNQQWYSFNDDYVNQIKDERELVTKNAYVLIYSRKNIVTN